MSLHADIMSREQTPISFKQIKDIISRHGVAIKFNFLSDMPERPTDNMLFGQTDVACIMCTLFHHGKPISNHWVCLLKRDNYYSFFDPLGHSIKSLELKLDLKRTPLSNWAAGKQVRHSSAKLQRLAADINTCGCHIAVRILHKKKSIAEYTRWLKKSFMAPDLSVSMLCYLDLLKQK